MPGQSPLDDKQPALRDIIQRHGLHARKGLGQHFLLDRNIVDKIVRLADLPCNAHVLEIGPGPGGMTRALLDSNAVRVDAIEYDQRCIAALEELAGYYGGGKLTIIREDALKLDYTRFADDAAFHIVANLPYNIATQLLINKLATIHARPGMIAGMTLMFQREVARRITAAPDSKSYGRLSVMSQWLCDVKHCMTIPAEAFTPPPQVTSSLVQFVPHRPEEQQPAFQTMEALLRDAFGKRRKMIGASLKSWGEALAACNINTRLRAENLSVDDFVRIARQADIIQQQNPQ